MEKNASKHFKTSPASPQFYADMGRFTRLSLWIFIPKSMDEKNPWRKSGRPNSSNVELTHKPPWKWLPGTAMDEGFWEHHGTEGFSGHVCQRLLDFAAFDQFWGCYPIFFRAHQAIQSSKRIGRPFLTIILNYLAGGNLGSENTFTFHLMGNRFQHLSSKQKGPPNC